MKRSSVLAFFAAALSACASRPAAPAQAGRAYFVQAGCAACHRIGSSGNAVGPDLTMVGFRHSPQWLDMWIKDPQAWKPGTLMPKKDIPSDARAAIVAYLAEQKGQAWPKGGRPWDGVASAAERGRLIYLRAGCVACHGQNGAGGYPNNNVPGGQIPSLTGVSEGYSRADLIAKIKSGVPSPAKADAAGPAPLVWMPAWGQVLSDAEIGDVADYLLALKPGAASDGW